MSPEATTPAPRAAAPGVMLDNVECPANILDQVSARLSERRVVVEKEVLKYGEAPAGIKEESIVASKMKEAFMGDKGLSGVVRKAELEKVFEISNVKKVCRYADGYQPHLVSPEKGIRALGIEALDQVEGPVKNCVQAVYNLLVNAAREAAERAGEHTEAALMGSLPMFVPDFKNAVMPAIVSALDEWKNEAEKMALMLVEMERSYITAGFFRSTMHRRSNKIKEQEAMMAAGQKTTAKGGGTGGAGAAKGGKSYFPAFGGGKEPEPVPSGPSASEGSANLPRPSEASEEDSVPKAPKTESAASSGFGGGNDPNDFVAAYFEKSGSDDSALTFGSLKWQRRFFIFSDSQRMLYYFKSPDDVPKANGLRGQVNVAECYVDDLDERGNPRGPGSAPPSSTDKAHWTIRIRHKDPRQNAVKEHNSVVLRAETFQAKVEWLARLRKASGEIKPKPAPAKAGDASKGGEGGAAGGGGGGGFGDDLSWAKDAEPILDTHLGEGASLFRAEDVRDAQGRLRPAPQVLLNPMRMADKLKNPTTTVTPFEVQYDMLLEQFGTDMSVYTRMVCDTVCITVPKAIVHCMIKKSEKNLLERLFSVIHSLTPVQMENLLREDDSVVQHRLQARKALNELKSAQYQVQVAYERYNMTAPSDRPESVQIPASAFAYSAMPDHLNDAQRAFYDKLFSDQFAPDSMRFWQQPPPKSVLPGQQPSPAKQSPEQLAAQQKRLSGDGQQPQGAGGPPRPQSGTPPQGLPRASAPQPGAPPLQRPSASPPMRTASGLPGGGAPPPVPMRPAPGAAQGPPMRRAPPPPPGGR